MKVSNTQLLVYIVIYLATISFSNAGTPCFETKHANVNKDIALSGYDAVSYFTSTKPMKGSAKINYKVAMLLTTLQHKQTETSLLSIPKSIFPFMVVGAPLQ